MAVTSHRSRTRTLSTSELLLCVGVTVLGDTSPTARGGDGGAGGLVNSGGDPIRDTSERGWSGTGLPRFGRTGVRAVCRGGWAVPLSRAAAPQPPAGLLLCPHRTATQRLPGPCPRHSATQTARATAEIASTATLAWDR